MKFSSLLVRLTAAALLLSSPAIAKTSVTTGEKLCKAAITAQKPEVQSPRVDKDLTRAANDTFTFTFRGRDAAKAQVKLACTVDRATEAVTLATAE
jgi:hypothetical protein